LDILSVKKEAKHSASEIPEIERGKGEKDLEIKINYRVSTVNNAISIKTRCLHDGT